MASQKHPDQTTQDTPAPTTSQHNPDYDPSTLHDIVANDHFGNSMPPTIVSAWVQALAPGNTAPLPPNVKGFYGGSLKASIPIEVARSSYKFIAHETTDKAKIKKYAERMLVCLDLLDVDGVAETEATIAVLALWHRALALVRLEGRVEELQNVLLKYEGLRPRSPVSDNKVPQIEQLKARLRRIAGEVGNADAVDLLSK